MQAFKDSTMSYFVNQLDKQDPKLHMPLMQVSYGRDVPLKTDVSFSNESTSFIRSSIAGGGTLSATGQPWVTSNNSVIPGVSLDGQRVVSPMRLLARNIDYTSVELERSQLLGQPIDNQKMMALNSVYQLNTDKYVYTGDTDVKVTGLINSSQVSTSAIGATFKASTPDDIVAAINGLITTAWQASGYAICPDTLGLPPEQYAYIFTTKVSGQANMSIYQYILQNAISLGQNGRELNIVSMKWLKGAGVSGKDRMIAYTKNEEFVRIPLVPIRRENPYFQGISFIAPYIWAYGELEFVYPETVIYGDGI